MELKDANELKEAMTGACNTFDKCGVDTTIARVVISLIDLAPTIETKPTWKPACVNPQESGTYLTVWDLCRNQKPFASYKILNYGDFEDWNDELKPKTGWWEFDNEWGVCDMTESVLYWMPLPEPPKDDEWI